MRYLLTFLILLVGCAPRFHEPLHPPLPGRVIVLHTDTEFSSDERSRLVHASQVWNWLNNGVVRFDIAWDFDAARTSSFVDHRNDYLILRTYSTNYAQGAVEPSGVKVLAYTDNHRVHLLMDRLHGDKFERVVLHELGHVLGLQDRPQPGYLMSKAYNTVACPSASEAVEVCERWNCSLQDVRYCD